MFADIANQLIETNRSRIELKTLNHDSFKITNPEPIEDSSCSCWVTEYLWVYVLIWYQNTLFNFVDLYS